MAAKKKPAAKPAAKKPATKPAAKSAVQDNSSYKKRSPQQAAKDLTLYVQDKNANLGKKGAPSAFVKAAQTDMGGLTADGIFGPKTKDRAATLLGTKSSPKPAPTSTAPLAAAALLSPPAPAAAVKPVLAAVEEPEPEPEPEPEIVEAAPAYAPSMIPQVTAVATPIAQPLQLPAAIQNEIAGIPPNIKSIIIEALNEFRNSDTATKADYAKLVTELSERFAPNLQGIAQQIEVAALQRQATSEHNALVKSDERWLNNNKNQQLIIDKLAELVKVIKANGSLQRKVYEVYGVHV